MKKFFTLIALALCAQASMAQDVVASLIFPDQDLAPAGNGVSTAVTQDPWTGGTQTGSIGLKKVGGYNSSNTANIYDQNGTYYHKLSGNDAYIRMGAADGYGPIKAGDVLTIVVWCNTTSAEQGISFGDGQVTEIENAKIVIPAEKAVHSLEYTLTQADIASDGSIYIFRQKGKSNFGIKSISIISKSEIINPTKTNFETIARFRFPDTAIGGDDKPCSDEDFTDGTTTNCSIGLNMIGGKNNKGSAQYYEKNSKIYNKFGWDDSYIKITLKERNFAVGDTLYARIWLGTGSLKYGFKFESNTRDDVTQSETWSLTTQEYTLAFELGEGDFSGNVLTIYRCTKKTSENDMGGDKFGVQEIWIERETAKEVSIGSTGYATFSGATYDYAVPAGCEAFVASSFADDVITISKIANGIIPANTGVLLKGAKGTYTLTAQAAAETVGTNLFKANVKAKTMTETETIDEVEYTNFILVPDGAGSVKFAKVSGGTLGAYKSYLQLPTDDVTARELSISFDDGETTGISEIEKMRNVGNEKFFDLQGRRVAQPTKGLYIVNGKKYIVK